MLYELWHSASEGCHTFVPENQRPPDLPADAKLIWSVEAGSWEEAMTAMHHHLVREPYRPLDD